MVCLLAGLVGLQGATGIPFLVCISPLLAPAGPPPPVVPLDIRACSVIH